MLVLLLHLNMIKRLFLCYTLYLEAYKGLRLPEDSPVSHGKQRNELGSSPYCQWH